MLALTASPAAVIGTRSEVNPVGGFATLATTATVNAVKVVQLTPVLVPPTGDPAPGQPISGTTPAGNLTGFGPITVNGTPRDVAVTRPNGANVPATVSITTRRRPIPRPRCWPRGPSPSETRT